MTQERLGDERLPMLEENPQHVTDAEVEAMARELRERRTGERRDVGLRALQAANLRRAAAWSAGVELPLDFTMMELAGEVGEACNAAKKLARLRYGIKGGSDTTANLAEELGDVAICLALAANKAGIDLAIATAAKFNATSEKYGFPHRIPLPAAPEVQS